MARKVLRVNALSMSSIEKLKKQLEEYNLSLTNRCKTFVQKLALVGLNVASVNANQSPLGHYIHFNVTNEQLPDGAKAILVMDGDVLENDLYEPFNTALAIEFGAGIHYNPTPNPNADKLGFGVGTFPGQTHAFDKNGWYFWDEKTETWKHSYGVKATMPMYKAYETMFLEAEKIAREVFGNV